MSSDLLRNSGQALQDYWFVLGPVSAAVVWLIRRLARRCARAVRRWREVWADLIVKVDRIDTALGPNGGRSIYDRLARIEGQVVSSGSAIGLIRARIDADQRATAEPRIELDADGRVTVINRAFEALTDRGASDISGLGLMGVVHHDDRARVAAEWLNAVRDRRWFELDLRLVARDGTSRATKMYAEPMRAGAEVFGWLVMFSLEPER